jgi:hypothetical protein
MSAAQAILGYIEGTPTDWIRHFSLERLKTPLRADDRAHGI